MIEVVCRNTNNNIVPIKVIVYPFTPTRQGPKRT